MLIFSGCDTGGICLRLILFSQYIKKSLQKKVQKEVHAKKITGCNILDIIETKGFQLYLK